MRRRTYAVAAVALAALATTGAVGLDAVRASDGVDPVQLAQRMAGTSGSTATDIQWVSTTRARADQHLFQNVVTDATDVLVIQFAADLAARGARGATVPRGRYGVIVVDARSGEVSSAGSMQAPVDLSPLGEVQRAD